LKKSFTWFTKWYKLINLFNCILWPLISKWESIVHSVIWVESERLFKKIIQMKKMKICLAYYLISNRFTHMNSLIWCPINFTISMCKWGQNILKKFILLFQLCYMARANSSQNITNGSCYFILTICRFHYIFFHILFALHLFNFFTYQI
jgi:hypothetical protein